MNFQKNNLNLSVSPYLQQHTINPVWWQPWSREVLEYAKTANKPILISSGYSTCHWCHVMAKEAFSDPGIAHFLNEHFISIKVDREERPDIDQYLMNFLVSIGGKGGWPLNCFLTPSLNPVFALTYIPVEPRQGLPGFMDVLKKVKSFYDARGETLTPFKISEFKPPVSAEEDIINKCYEKFDPAHGGFGHSNKFPPHSTLLYLLYYPYEDRRIHLMLEKTLDAMAMRGLFDHLQGGFFRYCVDRDWTIPHFEKMLYDQAMGLWTYSMAYRLLKKESYRDVALKIYRCLEESFEEQGLYKAAIDAESNHEEGAPYLWDFNELKNILSGEEWKKFLSTYLIAENGNLNGKNHLIRLEDVFIADIEEKILAARRSKLQPFMDAKQITSWNALTGVAFVQAYRYLGDEKFLIKAKTIALQLIEKHFNGRTLAHYSLGETTSETGFLEDGAAFLLLLTFLEEETGEFKDLMNILHAYVSRHRYEKGWLTGLNTDFMSTPASHFDHPTPSPVAMAEWGILRANILSKLSYLPGPFAEPVYHDFYNIAALTRNGLFHILTAPVKPDWGKVPLNTIWVRGAKQEDCFNGTCRSF